MKVIIKLYTIIVLIFVLSVLSGCSDTKKLTLSDVEKSFKSVGVKVEEQTPQSDSKAYNKVSPSTVLKTEDGYQFKVYIYPSEADSKKAQDEFNQEISKDLTYGLKETSIQAKNVLFISKWYSETDGRAIEKLR